MVLQKMKGKRSKLCELKGEREGLNVMWCPKKRSYSVTDTFF